MAVTLRDVLIINIYAPSGTSKRHEREQFFNSELTYLLRTDYKHIICGGDFNCVLQPIDVVGQFTRSYALVELIKGFDMRDAWTQNPDRPSYTYYHATGASRIDRFYLTSDLSTKKTGIKILPAAFTDHCAVALRLNINDHHGNKRVRQWKLHPSTAKDPLIQQKIRTEWPNWRKLKRYYTDVTQWWERCIKKRIKILINKETAERNADVRAMENHYYACIYETINSNAPHGKKLQQLNQYKAKLVRLQARYTEQTLLDQSQYDTIKGEQPSLFHLIKQKQRREERTTCTIQDTQGREITSAQDIAKIFEKHLKRKYEPIKTDDQHTEQMASIIKSRNTSNYAEHLEKPITLEELRMAINKGAPNKAPGADGLGIEFYKTNWGTIGTDMLEVMNHMFIHQKITPNQKHGIIICIPKVKHPRTPEEYRPITLLNTEYKILARIMAARLNIIAQDHLNKTQYCGVPGNNILDAIAQIRDAIAYSESTATPMCILSLDFQQAFDRIAHQYIFKILQAYGVTEWFTERIKSLYTDVTAAARINGTLTSYFPIMRGVRQGCPLSMVLYALSLHPLLHTLESRLTGFSQIRGIPPTPIVAYADDITIMVTHPADFDIIHSALQVYGKASGATLSPLKSRALAIAKWTAPPTILGIPFYPEVKILGVTFGPTIQQSINTSWKNTIHAVKGIAIKSYHRTLCLTQRIQYVRAFLLAKIWYLTQSLPPTIKNIKQLNAIAAWYIWHGAIFRVPMTTLQRTEDQGGCGMDNIASKCKMLLYTRMIKAKERDGAFTPIIMKYWKIDGRIMNPPKATNIPHSQTHLYDYAIDMAYIPPIDTTETTQAFKTRISKALLTMENNSNNQPRVRIMEKNPETPWNKVWKNLQTPGIHETTKSIWYEAIHDILPTNKRLAEINIAPNANCASCGAVDTVPHRLNKCAEGPVIWNWMKERMAAILRAHPSCIQEEWLYRPTYTFWPAQKQNAITWMIAHFVHYRLQNQGRQSLKELVDFLHRARWKVYHHPKRKYQMGRYLEVL
jgi:hypothetical protein